MLFIGDILIVYISLRHSAYDDLKPLDLFLDSTAHYCTFHLCLWAPIGPHDVLCCMYVCTGMLIVSSHFSKLHNPI